MKPASLYPQIEIIHGLSGHPHTLNASSSLEAYFVLIAVSIPTLRPIFKPKKVSTLRGPGSHGNGVNTFGSNTMRTAVGSSILTDNSNKTPFQRLWDPTTFKNDISSSGDGVDGAHAYMMDPMGPVGHGGPLAPKHHTPDTRIRKDITVSISLDRQSPSRQRRSEDESIV